MVQSIIKNEFVQTKENRKLNIKNHFKRNGMTYPNKKDDLNS